MRTTLAGVLAFLVCCNANAHGLGAHTRAQEELQRTSAAAEPLAHVVFGYHGESLAWLQQLPSDPSSVLLYAYVLPALQLNESQRAQSFSGAWQVVPRASNAGRECSRYIQHVVENYDRLAPLTVFVHGHGPHGSVADVALLLKCWQEPWAHGCYSVLHIAEQLTSAGYYATSHRRTLRCSGFVADTCCAYTNAFTAQFVDIILTDSDSVAARRSAQALGDALRRTNHTCLAADCCASFVVTREAVLQQPRRVYERLALLFDAAAALGDPEENCFHAENFWHVLFGSRPFYDASIPAKTLLSIAELNKTEVLLAVEPSCAAGLTKRLEWFRRHKMSSAVFTSWNTPLVHCTGIVYQVVS